MAAVLLWYLAENNLTNSADPMTWHVLVLRPPPIPNIKIL